jgi:hypothetical protein
MFPLKLIKISMYCQDFGCSVVFMAHHSIHSLLCVLRVILSYLSEIAHYSKTMYNKIFVFKNCMYSGIPHLRFLYGAMNVDSELKEILNGGNISLRS